MTYDIRNIIFLTGIIILVIFSLPASSQLLLFDKKVEVTGSFSAQSSVYTASNNQDRREPFSWRIYGNPRVKVNDFDIPMNLIIGSYEDRLRQAYNKFGMSPKYKEMLVVHLGHRNVNFSPLVLGGKTILGAGFELNVKKFRAGFMYGRFDRAILPDSLRYTPPMYRRSGYSAKIGIRTKSNYVDLVFLKAKDDEQSLENMVWNNPLPPAENAVIGLSVRQRIVKNFHFKLDAALSAYSRDTRAAEAGDADLLIVKIMQVMIPVRISNQYLTGIRSGLEYRRQKYNVGLEYDRVEPDFQSMGAWYIRNDIERLSAYGRFNALSHKLFVSARAGLQRNNILKDRSTRSFQNIKNLDVSYMPNKAWNFSLSYANFITRQTLELLGQDDSTLLDQNIHNASASATYRWSSEMKRHTLTGLVSFQNNNDRAKEVTPQVFRGFNTQVRYRIDFSELKLYFSPAFIFNHYKNTAATTARYSPSFIIGKSFYEQKMNAYLNTGFSFSISNGERQKTVFRNILNLSYKILSKQTLTLRLSLANNKGNALGTATFTEFTGDLMYTISL
jgi:hypothetical protein